ncbi:MAG: hypothetical protein V1854_05610, partial [Methanobacteriota archaeon]
RNEEALKTLDMALVINPNNENSLMSFIMACLNQALYELKTDNRGNAIKLFETAFKKGAKLKIDDFTSFAMLFLSDAVYTGKPLVIKAAVDEIIKLKDEYKDLIRPIIKALEIVETRDIKKYYDLQIEEREIVADIVRKITKSDNLLPEEIKRRETRLTDYATT